MPYYFLSTTTRSPELIIWSACVGIIVALVISYVVKKLQGSFISALIERGAFDTDHALTIKDTNACKLVKIFLKKDSSLRSVLSVCEELPEIDNIRFYIKEEHLKKATSFSKGVMKWYMLPVFAIATVVLAYIVVLLLPYLI